MPRKRGARFGTRASSESRDATDTTDTPSSKSKLLKRAYMHKPGSFLRIPLSDATYAYARELEAPFTAFYNHRTASPSNDLDEIANKPVLFRVAVRMSDPTRWERIGTKPLEGAVAAPVVGFHQEIGDFRKCVIFDNVGNERSATPEECIGLERDAVWNQEHIEERLLDTFMGRPNATEQHLRVRLRS